MKKLTTIIISLIIAQGLQNAKAQSWSRTGNAGTNASTDFIGTTDNVAFKVRTNNVLRINVTSTGKVGLGNFTPVFKLDVKGGSINTDSVYRIGGNQVLAIKSGSNIFAGIASGFSNTTGDYNAANGSLALYYNTTGDQNTANGYAALFSNTIGVNNTASGSYALNSNTEGNYNTANGRSTLFDNTTGSSNTANGNLALNMNTTGSYNSANGALALQKNTTGDDNTANGHYALIQNTTGNFNSGFGTSASFDAGNLSNTSCFGYNAGGFVEASNRVEIGNTSVSVIAGQVGWSTYSDERIKDNVEEDVPGLDFISKLRPVTYNLNIHRENEMIYKDKKRDEGDWDGKYDIEKIKMTGFLAQEVEKAANETGYDFSGVQKPANPGDLYSLRYSDFVMPLVKSVQELSNDNEELKMQNAELKNEIAEIKAALGLKIKSTEVFNQSSDFSFTIIPNPAKETATIHFANAPVKQLQLIVADATGKEVKSIAVSGNETQINTSEFAAGTYTVKLLDGNKLISTQKLFVTK